MNKCILSWVVVALVGVAVVLQSSSPPEFIDMNGWRLAQFVDYLKLKGLKLTAIPTAEDGQAGRSVYLSVNPGDNWLSFQSRNRNAEFADQWQGSVWIERLSSKQDIEWNVSDWGPNGCLIDRFVLFGDAQLIERILKSLNR